MADVDVVPGPEPEVCPASRRDDGQHSWRFDGDDPYIECAFCEEYRSATSGLVLRAPNPGLFPPEPQVEPDVRPTARRGTEPTP